MPQSRNGSLEDVGEMVVGGEGEGGVAFHRKLEWTFRKGGSQEARRTNSPIHLEATTEDHSLSSVLFLYLRGHHTEDRTR
jgi:hypothetical protein